MFKSFSLFIGVLTLASSLYAQPQTKNSTPAFSDSAIVRVHPSYDSVSGFHRWLFGKGYRKEWSIPVKLPLIKLSQINGGLVPLRQGGGMQSKSLRLKDKAGKEWVIRSVEKMPEKLLPPNLKGTFAVDWIDDAMSSQHPFAALVVPPLAKAAGVPHSSPVIGVVAPDAALGEYGKVFNGLVVLLEERKPEGQSDNTLKIEANLQKDNSNHFDAKSFLRARMLDLLLGDWDRHEDQWRWIDTKQGSDKLYIPVPRDRDQVFHVNDGVLPKLSALPYIMPTLQSFDASIDHVEYAIYKTRFMNAYPDAQLSYKEWMEEADAFIKAETDEVLQAGLKRLPREFYNTHDGELLTKLKKRRDQIPAAMAQYYRFIYKTADIRTSNKNELVTITDAPDKGLRIQINKLDKRGQAKGEIMNQVYNPLVTKEIRLYVQDGNDKVVINNMASPIKLRVIGANGEKTYEVKNAYRKVQLYSKRDSVNTTGNTSRINAHLNSDTSNTHYVANNPYNVWMPLATAAINADDGFLLGLGFKYTGRQGFRKLPYATVQQLMVTHSFATSAFRIRYNGEWIQAVGQADFTMNAYIQAPDNTLNFFGRGNQTVLNKFEGYRRFYRTRFDTYQFDPALRWHTGKNSTFSAGPSLQYYHLDLSDNAGRFITQSSFIKSYDSLTVNKDKVHVGLALNFNSNQRNNNILPSEGYYVNLSVQGYTGLNSYSKSYLQIKPEFTYYQKLNAKGTFVLTNRVGGGISVGRPAFYQSLFLGGQGNLLGYLQNRFAGDHMLYNNLQARVKLFDVASYILPGQLGLTGFYDTGRVWIKGESSDQWHTGTGGGLYFAPASLAVVQVLAGHSTEGWYPYISLNIKL
jgi:hypothetical protein